MRRLLNRIGLLLLLASLLVWPSLSDSAGPLPGPYRAVVLRVIDGDSFRAQVEVWPGLVALPNIRINGADTPELRGRCEQETERAVFARALLTSLLARGEVRLWQVGHDKYADRIAAQVTVQGEDVAGVLVKAQLARPYGGAQRHSWCTY